MNNLKFSSSRLEPSTMNLEDSEQNIWNHVHIWNKDEMRCQMKISSGISVRIWVPHNCVSRSWHSVCVLTLVWLPFPPAFHICDGSASSDVFVCSQQSNPAHNIPREVPIWVHQKHAQWTGVRTVDFLPRNTLVIKETEKKNNKNKQSSKKKNNKKSWRCSVWFNKSLP